jgi:hypothetical protein
MNDTARALVDVEVVHESADTDIARMSMFVEDQLKLQIDRAAVVKMQ